MTGVDSQGIPNTTLPLPRRSEALHPWRALVVVRFDRGGRAVQPGANVVEVARLGGGKRRSTTQEVVPFGHADPSASCLGPRRLSVERALLASSECPIRIRGG